MLGGVAEERRRQRRWRRTARRLLGVDQLAVRQLGDLEIVVLVLDRLDLAPRAIEFARKHKQLEEEQPFGMVGGRGS